jgi:hypothetical protein
MMMMMMKRRKGVGCQVESVCFEKGKTISDEKDHKE